MAQYWKTHWMTWTNFYNRWKLLKKRCNNINDPRYKWYWERWIFVCDKWNKFEWFMEDMYESYIEHRIIYWEQNTSIDRINNNWNYCKENCRRATKKEQMRNTSRNYKIIQQDLNWNTIKIWNNRVDIKEEWFNIWNIRSCCNWKRNNANWYIRKYFTI